MSSEQREPLENPGLRLQVGESDAVMPTQAGLGLEPHRVQEQRNVEEVSIQASIEEAHLGLESSSSLNVERGAIQGNGWVAVQSTQAGLGLEIHGFQEQPNVDSGVAVQELLQSLQFQFEPNWLQALSDLVAFSIDDCDDLVHLSINEQPLILEGLLQTMQSTSNVLEALSHRLTFSMEDSHDLVHFSVKECALIEERLHSIRSGCALIEECLLSIQSKGALIEKSPQQSIQIEGFLQSLRVATGNFEASHQEEASINDRNLLHALSAHLSVDGQALIEMLLQSVRRGISPRRRNDRNVPQDL